MEEKYAEAAFGLAQAILKSYKGDYPKATKFCGEIGTLIESSDSGMLEFMSDPKNIKRVASMAKMFGMS